MLFTWKTVVRQRHSWNASREFFVEAKTMETAIARALVVAMKRFKQDYGDGPIWVTSAEVSNAEIVTA